MKTKIFSIENDHSANVRWYKVTDGNSVSVDADWHDIDYGICMGMVLVWLKKSIATKGKGIQSVDQLGSPHLMAIVHGAYRRVVASEELKHEVDIITRMFIIHNLTPDKPIKGTGYFDPGAIVDWALKEPGHCLFSFGAAFGSLDPRHSLGIRYENQIIEMFDPCEGLFQYTDEASFKEHLIEVCYQELSCCLGGEWAALKEISATG